MIEDIRADLAPLLDRVEELHEHLGIAARAARVHDLEEVSALPAFWDDQTRAQATLKEKGQLERTLNDYRDLVELGEEIQTLMELAEEEDDPGMIREARDAVGRLELGIEALETRRLFSEAEDLNDAIMEVNPGAGGTDAQDWAEMLFRMYSRWAEVEGYTVELLDRQDAEEAGIKSASLAIRGPYAYGMLQSESGVHRLVRISPFDQNARRHTAFAAVAVIPDVDDTIEIDINPADIKTDTMRASGAGGQHVNTTDSAVRLTHMPTGTVVLCRAERSQHKNRDKAMKLLKAKLYQLEVEKRNQAIAEVNSKKMRIDFGSQIRSYVLQPYQQVKDSRTGYTVGDVTRVLDGELSGFMRAWLAARAAEQA
ncbi:MAG: peptide chain release factor 2 [Deltaproteobacteria bacterium]|nr:peptide chain release factor 2 [Deltaproteobacteria bacterium]